MIGTEDKPEALLAFESLPMGRIYFLGERDSLEAGLLAYQKQCVRKLEVRKNGRSILAVVRDYGEKSNRVTLITRNEDLGHKCGCASWKKRGCCKHVIAAAAAVFMATQGKSAGGFRLPETYVGELRRQLGYEVPESNAAEDGSTGASATEETESAEAAHLLHLNPENGYLEVKAEGALRPEIVDAIGTSRSVRGRRASAREAMYLNNPDEAIPGILETAGRHGIPFRVDFGSARPQLYKRDEPVVLSVVLDGAKEEVHGRLKPHAMADGTKVFGMIPQSGFALLEDGGVAPVAENPVVPIVLHFPAPEGMGFDLYFQRTKLTTDSFNAMAALYPVTAEWVEKGLAVFRSEGAESGLTEIGEEDVGVEVRADLLQTGDLSELYLSLYFVIDGHAVDCAWLRNFVLERFINLEPWLWGGKKKLRGLIALLREYVASGESRRNELFSTFAEMFEILRDERTWPDIEELLKAFENFLNAYPEGYRAPAFDPDTGHWLSYVPPLQKACSFVLELMDPTDSHEMEDLDRGRIHLFSREEERTYFRRIAAAAGKTGAAFFWDSNKVREAPVTAEVSGRKPEDASGEIDWFELHPEVRCGDWTLGAEQWRQMLRGELVLRAEDGSWVVPDMGGMAEGSDELLELLGGGGDAKKKGKTGAGEVVPVSRLQMLDWISLRRHGVAVHLPEEAERLFEGLLNFERLPEFEVPDGLKAELRPYQKEGCAWINFLYEHRFGACLADDMGLGKTIQAIGFVVERLRVAPTEGRARILVVVPPSLAFNWLDEFERFAPGVRVVECLRSVAFENADGAADVLLTTYERVRIDIEKLEQRPFDIVIFDEAHNMKNVTAGRTKAAGRLQRRFTLCLTGTPVENNANEFYSVMTIAVPGIFGNLPEFKKAYKRTPERLSARARPFLLRRTKEKILHELPPKEERDLYLEMSALQKEIYTRTVAEVRQEVAEAFADRPQQQAGIVALAALLRLRQVCVSPSLLGKSGKEPAPKMKYLLQKLEELRAEGHSALVFSQFRGALDELAGLAEKHKLPYLQMDGRTPVVKRKQLVADFQAAGEPRYFFISLKTGGVGLNLTRAEYVFHLDPWWNPAVENQASDRAHRIGQENSVFIQRLIMQHTIEERMLELKAKKADLFRQLVDEPGAKAAAGLSRKDFEFLIHG